MKDTAPYAIIVNTNEYTGNFEREFCAFTTGAIGECGVGDEESENYNVWAGQNKIKVDLLADYTDSMADDSGCHRPVSIYDDTGTGDYNDIIIYLSRPLSVKLWKVFEKRAALFTQDSEWDSVQILGMRMVKRTIVVTDVVIQPGKK
jgi:hypothetical protein